MSVPGYAGKFLRVDLTEGTLRDESYDESTLRRWLGGTGLGAKVLYEEVPPGTPWSGPANRLIIASGPLGGARMAGTGSYSVVTKGTLTGGAACSQANGFFGSFIKFSGYDGIIVQGVSPRWVYLYIHDGAAELRDARHLMGKDTWETEDLIKGELGRREKQMSVFSVGLAGENGVPFAAIVGDKGHVAGHNGIGAVMGSKRLKAFCADRGKGAMAFHDLKAVSKVAKDIFDYCQVEPGANKHYLWGTTRNYLDYGPTGVLPIKNLTTSIFPEYEKFGGPNYRPRWELKPNPCWACKFHHCYIVTVKDGPCAGFVGEEGEYEIMVSFGSLIGQTDPGVATMLANEVDRLGLEGNEAGWLMGMVIELYEKGVLTREDTDGLEMRWGNWQAVKAMLSKVARQEGFGRVLAQGVKKAAEAIGREAVECAVYLNKGQSPRGHDHRARWYWMFDEATSNTGGIETGGIARPQDLGLPAFTDQWSPEQIPFQVAKNKGKDLFVDSLVCCNFSTGPFIQHLVPALNAATGWDFDIPEALRMGERVANLLRAFNLRQGITPEVEYPSARYGSAPVDGPIKGKSIRPHWDGMLDSYYQHMGWDRKSGRPLPETLRSLGLEHIIPDLWGKETSKT
ncbi:MAG: aldehyde ferredoxin oxidoreductase C-terminal domain-containing protein [Chloroflexota bacterium]|nr:aldehyde ferredoxin oxidoreductase C-terminal domain-containing protein [Chloroflexota bacterium]